jgi:hypothetical protein
VDESLMYGGRLLKIFCPIYQKGVYFAGIKIFNHLPQKIKKLSDNTNTFKRERKKFLLLGSFYSFEEFYEWASKRNLTVYL